MKNKYFNYFFIITILNIFSCSSDSQIKALYNKRPCQRQIILNSITTCTQSEARMLTFEKNNGLEKNVQFDKQKIVDCPYTTSLISYKWEPSVYFDYNVHTLNESAKNILNKNIKLLINNPLSKIVIHGFTDSRGNNEYNQKLANRRSLSTFQYLKNHGIADNRILIFSIGESAPLFPNNSEKNMAFNRRVEMLLLNDNSQPMPYVIFTKEIQNLLYDKIDKNTFCEIWKNKILWYPAIFFQENQCQLDSKENDEKLAQNIKVLINNNDFMVSIREFHFSNNNINQISIAKKRISLIEQKLYKKGINKKRIQVVSPKDTNIYQSNTNKNPCVEMLLLDRHGKPFSAVIMQNSLIK